VRIVIDLPILHDHLRRFASGSIAPCHRHEQSTADAFHDRPDAFEHVSRERRSGGLVCGERRPNAAEINREKAEQLIANGRT
jgi:hypothetical protein